MGQAIGQVLSLAVAVAISPMAIIGIVLMLVTPRARTNGPSFLAGWLLGLSVVGAIVLLVSPDATSDSGAPATWVSWLRLVLGVLLVLLALKDWRGRPRDAEKAPTPKWMGAIARFNAVKALAAGAVLSAANPKNLLLALAAGASIAQAGIPGGEQAVAYAVFALIGAIGVLVPLVIYFALGDRAGPILDGIKSWMAQHNAVIMTVLLLVIGAKLIGDAIAGFGG
jgi:threonine/homoserine/homoserine lactone efflux protein